MLRAYVGPMGAGKTSALLHLHKIAHEGLGLPVQILKPRVPGGLPSIVSHDGQAVDCEQMSDEQLGVFVQTLSRGPLPAVLLADEAQMWAPEALAQLISAWRVGQPRSPYSVLALAGLDFDAGGQAYPWLDSLAPDEVEKLTGHCSVCQAPSVRTLCTSAEGRAVIAQGGVWLGDFDSYAPVCMPHFEAAQLST